MDEFAQASPFDFDAYRREALEPTYDGLYLAAMDADGPVKVGVANNPIARLGDLQVGNPFKIHLADVFYVKNREARLLELNVHSKMRELGLHIRGEWFDCSVEDASAVIFKMAEIERFKFIPLKVVAGQHGSIFGNVKPSSDGYEIAAFIEGAAAAVNAVNKFRKEHDLADRDWSK